MFTFDAKSSVRMLLKLGPLVLYFLRGRRYLLTLYVYFSRGYEQKVRINPSFSSVRDHVRVRFTSFTCHFKQVRRSLVFPLVRDDSFVRAKRAAFVLPLPVTYQVIN